MSKIRVYELARELNLESKILLNSIKSMGINVTSHQSTLSDDDVQKIKQTLKGENIHKSLQTENPLSIAAKDKKGNVKVIRRSKTSSLKTPDDSASPSISTPSVSSDTKASDIQQSSITDSKLISSSQQLTNNKGIDFTQVSTSTVQPTISNTNELNTALSQEAVIYDTNEKTSDKSSQTSSSTVSEQNSQSTNDSPTTITNNATVLKQPKGSSATIVRRSAIQIDNLQQDTASTYPSGGAISKSKKIKAEDNTGMKFTGIGSPTARAKLKTSSTVSFNDINNSELIDTNLKKKTDRLKTSEDDLNEYKSKKKFFIKGKKNEHINTKLLLRNLDLFDEEDQDTDSLVDFDLNDDTLLDSKVYTHKTVYTPSTVFRKKDLKRKTNLKKTQITVAREAYRTIKIKDFISVADLAKHLKVKASELISKLMQQGIMVNINDNIDYETAALLASEYNYEVKQEKITIDEILGINESMLDKAQKITRPPIVTVMGHVDHGKTSILDAIRHTNVAAGEAGGITQHIGAYTVNYHQKLITFLDTPGHEAFSAMRARGANVTDIVVLVVAADDGVKPQTIEAISHANVAKVPIIVAINKIDKEGINLDKIYQELAQYGIQSEEWGGENIFVKVSALKKQGIDELLQAILLISEFVDLNTFIDLPAKGIVIETKLDSNKGAMTTVIVKQGILKKGDQIIVGTQSGKIRVMYNHLGEQLQEAYPSIPVQIIGLDTLPQAGDNLYVVKNDKMAKTLIEHIKEESNNKDKLTSTKSKSLEELLAKIKEAEVPELNIILKADTHGSLEAISEALSKINSDKVKNKIIHKAIGGISESDVMLSKTSDAVIIGFNIRPARGVDDIIKKHNVPVKYFSIIYELIDAVKSMMIGKLPPLLQEEIIGHAEVKQSFVIPKVGTIAGATVIDGKVIRNANVRLIRDSVIIYTGKISSLKRFKEDVKEVKNGYECGIGIENYNDIKPGDIIETYILKEVAPTI